MISTKNRQLQGLAGGFPSASLEATNTLDATRVTGLQNAVAAAPQAALTTQATQQAGAQQASAMGQARLQVAQQAQQQASQIGRLALGNDAQDNQESLANRQLGLAKQQRDNVAALGNLDAGLKQTLYDANMTFQQDELGRTLFNDSQLMDYKLATAQSEEDWLNFEQQVKQTSDRKMQMLKVSYQKLEQALQQDDMKNGQSLDQATKLKLVTAKAALQQKIAKEKAKQANRAGAFQAGGMIVGAVAGGVIGSFVAPGVGTAAGAALGAQVGGSAGSVAASQTE